MEIERWVGSDCHGECPILEDMWLPVSQDMITIVVEQECRSLDEMGRREWQLVAKCTQRLRRSRHIDEMETSSIP